jgi:hypothetical protein
LSSLSAPCLQNLSKLDYGCTVNKAGFLSMYNGSGGNGPNGIEVAHFQPYFAQEQELMKNVYVGQARVIF